MFNWKLILTGVILLVTAANSLAQEATVTWGESFKLKKGSTDLEVIHADNTGIYVKESHMALRSYFVIGATLRESATLIKLDKSFDIGYSQDFNKELKGREFEKLFFIKDKLFLLATAYVKKEKKLSLFASEVDKPTGELKGDWVEVTSWQKEEKSDDINFNISYNPDSSQMVLVSTLEGKGKNSFEVREFDQAMKLVGKPIFISNEFEKDKFQLEDVIYTRGGNVVMVARIYEYQEGKKKKKKFLQFMNYHVRIYNPDGTMLKDMNTDIIGKWLVSAKVVQMPDNDLVLAAFYSDERKRVEVNGMLVQRINPETGEVITTNNREISTALIDKVDDEDDDDGDDESKKERRERKRLEKIQEDDDGFSRYMRFRQFLFTPDNGIVVLAEKYRNYRVTTVNTSGGGAGMGGMMRTTTTTYDVYECGDLMMSKIDVSGKISWLHVLPKYQREQIEIGSNSSYGTGFTMGSSYFPQYNVNRPFYGGFAVLKAGNSAVLLFNDHKKNTEVLQLGQKYKRTSYFRKSVCYGLKLDMITGKYTRTRLFDNDDQPTAMPRLGTSLGKDLYIVGKEDRLFGKSKIAIARISVK